MKPPLPPPPTLSSRALSALWLGVGPAVMAVMVLATPLSAAPTPSPRETGEAFLQSVPEPASAILGILGFCLILFRRGKS